MTVDHDRCEWVNVFLVPAYPCCAGQNPESHKTVVCVCGVCGSTSCLELVSLWNIVRWSNRSSCLCHGCGTSRS